MMPNKYYWLYLIRNNNLHICIGKFIESDKSYFLPGFLPGSCINTVGFVVVDMELARTSAEKWTCFRFIMLTESSRNRSHDEALVLILVVLTTLNS